MSSAGIAPKNHPKQIRTRRSKLYGQLPCRSLFGEVGTPDDVTDGVDDRRTPQELFDRLHARFNFTIDVAASADNALLPRYFTRDRSGLEAPWADEMAWCNPPYSDIPSWVAKANDEVRCGCLGVVLLLPADRTEQPWWHEYVEPWRDRGLGVRTEFIRKRVKFGLPPGHPAGDAGLAQGRKGGGYRYPPFGCVLVIFEARKV